MEYKMGFFNKYRKKEMVKLPPELEPINPVNYNSVLDYLIGLSNQEYNKILKVTDIYRDANKSAAKVLGVKEEPTTSIKSEEPTEEQVEDALDAIISQNTTRSELENTEVEFQLLDEDSAKKESKK